MIKIYSKNKYKTNKMKIKTKNKYNNKIKIKMYLIFQNNL